MAGRLHFRQQRPPESGVLRACLELLQALGIIAFRVNGGAVAGEHQGRRRFVRFTSVTGVSDIIGVLPAGRALFVETKAPRGKLAPAQRLFLEQAAAAGALCVVARDVQDLIAALRSAGVMA